MSSCCAVSVPLVDVSPSIEKNLCKVGVEHGLGGYGIYECGVASKISTVHGDIRFVGEPLGHGEVSVASLWV